MPGQLIEMQDVSAELLRELSPQLDQDHIRRVTTAIERLGYGLVRADGVDEGTRGQDVLARIRQPEAKVSDLLPLWQERNAEMPEWKQPETYALLAKRFIDLGVPYTAQEVAEAGLSFATPQDRLQLRHLKGLALARSGQVDAASQVLCDKELAELPRDEELRGLEAALQKQLGLQIQASKERSRHRDQHLRLSCDFYRAAWQAHDGSFWTGINVASLHLLLGERDQAAQVARQISAECLREDDMKRGTEQDDPYWRWATLGEASLNLGDLGKAEEWYRQAAGAARGRVGHLNSTRRQLRHLLEAIGETTALVDAWLPIPGVAIFTGHRIDAGDRHTPRFPSSLETQVKEAISHWLVEHSIRVCVCSAANGADILFLEALQAFEGCDTRIVLPFSEAQFQAESVRNGEDESWVSRFQQVMQKASRVTIASSDRVGHGGQPFDYANRLIIGQGLMLKKELQTSLSGLAVWNGQAGDGPGGTAHTIERWRQQDLTVYTIDLSNPQSVSSPAAPLVIRCEGPNCEIKPPAIAAAPPTAEERATPVMSMLFADVEGFSKLSDREVELFITHFLGRVAQCVEKHAPAEVIQPDQWRFTSIPVRETWGDGLYFAFSDVKTAGLFALDLCDAVRETKWQERFGFSTDLRIRIALHSGPVHLGQDPITGLPKCTGAHVSRAARLEPKTPPNHVYASDAFAALVAEQHVTGFSCEFVKLLDWAKHYGTYPTYVVNRG